MKVVTYGKPDGDLYQIVLFGDEPIPPPEPEYSITKVEERIS